MTLAISCSFVASVQVTLVLQEQFLRFECCSQALPNKVLPFRTQGSTFLNGFTVTFR